jgi:DNA replication and repair protein RecF
VSLPTLLRLRLHDFRCFARLDWRPPGGRLVLVGANGTGKTTLLEAVYLAATTRSFRAPRPAACVRRGTAGFSVVAEVGERPRRELAVAWSSAGRTRTLDGKETPLVEHLAALPVLAWSRGEAELVAGGPAARRSFLDRGLVHVRPAVLEDLARYRRALAEKRALLARRDERGLEAWNALLARHGAALGAARARLAEEVGHELAELARRHAPELSPLALRYRPAAPATLAGEAELARALEAARGEELARRSPLVGPHRDEVELEWAGVPVRGAVSAGEAKALGLLLVAALARRLARAEREPTLLLDDADAELDAARVARIAEAFAGFERVLVTSSRGEVWRGVPGFEEVPLGGAAGGLRRDS